MDKSVMHFYRCIESIKTTKDVRITIPHFIQCAAKSQNYCSNFRIVLVDCSVHDVRGTRSLTLAYQCT